jgi:Putative stress-induced transcription regulator
LQPRRPALALVNSRRNDAGAPVDDLGSPAGLAAWLAEQGLAPEARVDDAALAAVRELRGAVRELLETRLDAHEPDQRAVETSTTPRPAHRCRAG